MKRKILIIEDDTNTRKLYEDLFDVNDFAVDYAADGEEGLLKARGGGYHLVLLDVMLPKLDGLGVLKGLQVQPSKAPNGKIVLLSNFTHDDVVQEALKNGASDYILKEKYNPDELLAKIKTYL